eukprot:8563012-Heterocapsa_arctica.AAC.1
MQHSLKQYSTPSRSAAITSSLCVPLPRPPRPLAHVAPGHGQEHTSSSAHRLPLRPGRVPPRTASSQEPPWTASSPAAHTDVIGQPTSSHRASSCTTQ